MGLFSFWKKSAPPKLVLETPKPVPTKPILEVPKPAPPKPVLEIQKPAAPEPELEFPKTETSLESVPEPIKKIVIEPPAPPKPVNQIPIPLPGPINKMNQIPSFRKGDYVYVRGFVPPAKVLVILMMPGKPVGVQFGSPIPQGHDCDGLGKRGFCWWAHPEDLRLMVP